MKLYLARHGDSSTTIGSDDERPLSDIGIQDVKNLADFIVQRKISVAHVFHSQKKRARETAEILAPALQFSGEFQVRRELDPMADVSIIMHEVEALNADVLLVGHMPFMGRLAGVLLTKNEYSNIVNFKTATIICLEQIECDKWTIDWMLSPIL